MSSDRSSVVIDGYVVTFIGANGGQAMGASHRTGPDSRSRQQNGFARHTACHGPFPVGNQSARRCRMNR